MRHTKIIATVGPASDTDDMLDALIAAGTDIFRLNFSHGTHESQARDVRARPRGGGARRPRGRDPAGSRRPEDPHRAARRRHGRFTLKPGDTLRIATGDFARRARPRSRRRSRAWRAACSPAIACCSPTASIELRVESTDGAEIQTTVVEGGELGEHKGINAPGVPLPASAITPKDVDDLQFGLSLGVDMVALSFVQTAADLRAGAPADGRSRRAATCRSSPSSSGRRRSSTSTRSSTPATR